MNLVFANIIIIAGIIDVIIYAHSLISAFLLYYPPCFEITKQFISPNYGWTAFYALTYYLSFLQYFMSTYISFSRVILVIFGKGVFLLFFVSAIPTWHLWMCQTMFNLNYRDEKDGGPFYIQRYIKQNWMYNISNFYHLLLILY
uniref:7TM_GPCR_Srx domain-containing protein n=1 Tax=Parastrongyloides trichosuri TaxID=131310 RepID=A0A0N5A701_PARTI